MSDEQYSIRGIEVDKITFYQEADGAYKRWKEKMKQERPYAKFPCGIKCISFAICKSLEQIECSLLYNWIRVGVYYHGKKNSKVNYRIRKLENLFEKRMAGRTFTNTHKKHPTLKVIWSNNKIKGD